jgi:hypothetical protein
MAISIPSDPQSSVKPPDRNPLVYGALLLLAVSAYVGYLFLSRYESNRAVERRNAEKVREQQRADDRAAIQQFGGSELAIHALYVSPTVIHPGEKSQLCYDVDNAKTVSLDPPAGEVWPSHTRCLDLSPTKTTTYTLTIGGATGKSLSQTVELRVEEAPPIHIKSFPSN